MYQCIINPNNCWISYFLTLFVVSLNTFSMQLILVLFHVLAGTNKIVNAVEG